MAEQKKVKNRDEDVLRYIFESRFFPERLIDKESEYANNLSYIDDDLFKLMDGAKSYTEARNLLIDGLNDQNILGRARDAAKAYFTAFGKEGEDFDGDKAFLSPLERIPLNIERLPYDFVEQRGNDIATALKYTNGIESMLADMNNRNKIMTMLGEKSGEEYRQHIAREIAERLKDESLDKSRLLELMDLTPNADADYIANKASEYAERVNRKKNHEKMGDLSRMAQSFVIPYQEQSTEEGLKPGAIDVLFDVVSAAAAPVVGTKISKTTNAAKRLEKAAEKGSLARLGSALVGLSGIGAIAGSVEPFVTRGHDALETLFSNNVYAHEGEDNEVSERGDVKKALRLSELLDDVRNGFMSGAMASAVGIGGRGGGRVLKGLGEKIANSNAGKKVLTGLDALFGSSGKGKKAYNDLMDEKKTIEGRIEDWTRNPKSLVSDEAKRQYDKRLSQIERHQGAYEKAYEKAAQNAGKTAYDALVYSALVKAGLNPEMKARDVAKGAYVLNLLSGGD